MWKTVLAGTAALAIAGSPLAVAQQAAAPDTAQRADAAERWQPSAEDRAAIAEGRIDGRIAEFKTALRLTPDQEKSWPAFEQAIRERAKEREARWAERRDRPRGGDLIERLERRADAMAGAGAGLKRLAEAAKPLYQSLDDSQKQRFEVLSRAGRPHRFAFWHNGERGEYRGDFRGQRGEYRGEFQGQRGEFRGQR
jgi:hypothetical protein